MYDYQKPKTEQAKLLSSNFKLTIVKSHVYVKEDSYKHSF